jgi:hypothetical protein
MHRMSFAYSLGSTREGPQCQSSTWPVATMTNPWRPVGRLLYYARSYSWVKDWLRLKNGLPDPCVEIDRPIFLLGLQGGGLTLLSRMLRRHPSTVSAAGDHTYWTSADEIQNVFGMLLPAELTGLRYKAPPHAVLKPPRSWTYATDEILPMYRQTESDATPELKRAIELVLRYCIGRFGHERSGRFVDKSQVFTVRLGLLYSLLKEYDPRFVLLSRNPYVSVYRAASGKAGDMRRLRRTLNYGQRIVYCAQHYHNSMAAVLEDSNRLCIPLHVVQFEQLIARPEAELARVCEFLGLSFEAEMLPTAHQRMPWGSRFQDRWYPVKSDINRSYEERIDRLVLDAVNARSVDIIRRLGYEILD